MESLAIHSHRPASQAEQTIIEPVAAFGFYILPDTIQNSCSDKATNFDSCRAFLSKCSH